MIEVQKLDCWKEYTKEIRSLLDKPKEEIFEALKKIRNNVLSTIEEKTDDIVFVLDTEISDAVITGVAAIEKYLLEFFVSRPDYEVLQKHLLVDVPKKII